MFYHGNLVVCCLAAGSFQFWICCSHNTALSLARLLLLLQCWMRMTSSQHPMERIISWSHTTLATHVASNVKRQKAKPTRCSVLPGSTILLQSFWLVNLWLISSIDNIDCGELMLGCFLWGSVCWPWHWWNARNLPSCSVQNQGWWVRSGCHLIWKQQEGQSWESKGCGVIEMLEGRKVRGPECLLVDSSPFCITGRFFLLLTLKFTKAWPLVSMWRCRNSAQEVWTGPCMFFLNLFFAVCGVCEVFTTVLVVCACWCCFWIRICQVLDRWHKSLAKKSRMLAEAASGMGFFQLQLQISSTLRSQQPFTVKILRFFLSGHIARYRYFMFRYLDFTQ